MAGAAKFCHRIAGAVRAYRTRRRPPRPAAATTAGDESSRIAGLFKGDNLALGAAELSSASACCLSLTPCVFPMIPDPVGHHRQPRPRRQPPARLRPVAGLRAGHGRHLRRGRRRRRTVRHAPVRSTAERLGPGRFRPGLRRPCRCRCSASTNCSCRQRCKASVSDTANRQGGSLPAIALMGALSALIVGPCVAAPLAGALLYIAQTGDAVLGGSALFVMALGMGAPLLLVGAFSRSLLPKSGPWMEGHQEVLRRHHAGHRAVAGIARDSALATDAGLGIADGGAGDLPACARPPAAACAWLAAAGQRASA
jgi:thiol:disulfide interchange protein DsbD